MYTSRESVPERRSAVEIRAMGSMWQIPCRPSVVHSCGVPTATARHLLHTWTRNRGARSCAALLGAADSSGRQQMKTAQDLWGEVLGTVAVACRQGQNHMRAVSGSWQQKVQPRVETAHFKVQRCGEAVEAYT